MNDSIEQCDLVAFDCHIQDVQSWAGLPGNTGELRKVYHEVLALRQRVKELEEYARKMDESAESIGQFIGEVCHSSWCAGWSMGQVPNQPSSEHLREQRIADCRRIIERMLKIASKNVFESPAEDARHD